MLEKNEGLIIEVTKLEKGAFTGKIILHFSKGIAQILDIPKKPIRKEIPRVNIRLRSE